MSGDLEDFLRRAAQRRQAKSAQQQPQRTQSRPARSKPQYSDSRTERLVRPPTDEVADAAGQVAAELESNASQRERLAEVQRAVASASAAKAKSPQPPARLKREARPQAAAGTTSSPDTIGPAPVLDLIRLLQRPGGIQQAVLLREILDRPTHRW